MNSYIMVDLIGLAFNIICNVIQTFAKYKTHHINKN